jgi:hypothetical protein
MPLVRPVQRPARARNRQRTKELLDLGAADRKVIAALRMAAERAVYESYAYHRPHDSRMGRPATRRYPHASKCESHWEQQTATAALREALREGRVSAAWDGVFPRFAWQFNGDVLYEARLSNRESGAYHAYPLEDKREWPTQLRLK